MTAQTIFHIIISILILNFLFDLIINYINAQHFKDKIPTLINDIYNNEDYKKSQDYKKANYNFNLFQSIISFIGLLLFIFFDGFKLLNDFVLELTQNQILISLLYFAFIYIAVTILSLPFSYYHSFVIEERFGFNKMSKTLFVKDKIKGFLLAIIIGGLVLTPIIWFYLKLPKTFWLYTWVLITAFSVFMNLFYTSLILPIFNKLTPLKDGDLKNQLKTFANNVNFKLDNIFIIDGSQRSSKANAFFSGFGSHKKVVLYDTLLNQLNNEEIVGVLSHEIGHYKKKHIIYNLILGILQTGLILFILSFFINNNILAQSIGLQTANFHIGLIVFAILYTPISVLTSLFTNILSRKFEYQADNYAKKYGYTNTLISALKKLSKTSYSNLTPHPFYVFINYSHPTILQRIINLNQKEH